VLPEFLANVPRRFATPATASIVFGLLVIVLGWVYLLATSVEGAFDDVVNMTGLLFAIFYILTALACVVYYRRRVITGVWNAIALGLLPLAAAVFLGWMVVKTLMGASDAEQYSLLGVVVVGLAFMLGARYLLKSPFFAIQRESDSGVPAVPEAEGGA
jgi:amino acid transporter